MGLRTAAFLGVLCAYLGGCASVVPWHSFRSRDLVWYQKGVSVAITRTDYRQCQENLVPAGGLKACMIAKGYLMIPREEAELLRVRTLRQKGLNEEQIAERLRWTKKKVSRYADDRYKLAPVDNLGTQPVDILANLGKAGVEPLISELGSDDPLVRRQAAQALGEIGDPLAVEPLLGTMKDQDPLIRRHTIEALGKIGSARSVVPLLNLVANDREPSYVRAAAATALGKIGQPEAVPFLIDALNAPDWNLRVAAAEALGIIGDPRAVQPLIVTLADGDPLMRSYGAQALGKLGDLGAAESLRMMLDTETNKDARKKAEQALNQIERRMTP